MKLQLAPAAKPEVHVLAWLKSPLPPMEAADIVSAPLPLLVTVIVCGELVPKATEPKAMLAEDSVTCGAGDGFDGGLPGDEPPPPQPIVLRSSTMVETTRCRKLQGAHSFRTEHLNSNCNSKNRVRLRNHERPAISQ